MSVTDPFFFQVCLLILLVNIFPSEAASGLASFRHRLLEQNISFHLEQAPTESRDAQQLLLFSAVSSTLPSCLLCLLAALAVLDMLPKSAF